jgi:hypothetical protein
LKGPMLDSRLVAAKFLLQRDNTDGIAPMIAEWHTLEAKPQDTEFSECRLIDFLAWCGRKESVEALAVNLKNQPFRRRMRVVWALRVRTCLNEEKILAPEVQAAMDTILAECLSDAERPPGEASRDHSRICDMAAFFLAQCWGQPNLFNISATTEVRDRQLIAVKNVWLKKQGKPTLPLPAISKGEARN